MLPGKYSIGKEQELGYFLYLCINIINDISIIDS